MRTVEQNARIVEVFKLVAHEERRRMRACRLSLPSIPEQERIMNEPVIVSSWEFWQAGRGRAAGGKQLPTEQPEPSWFKGP